ncbi:MAG: DUF2785 domain-containing protein [Firmicutes bacterium]|nr:DUF2785 domain-containing protein [Bacillota bacterium]
MHSNDVLKAKLRSIRESNWELDRTTDIYNFACELLSNIGSIDGELRDELILTALYEIITCQKISTDQTKELLWKCLSDEHLFNGIGKLDNDSVFNRSFTSLIIRWILWQNNRHDTNFLDNEEISHVLSETLRYCANEKDFRGFVNTTKGWAHSASHISDVLWELAKSQSVRVDGLISILYAIKEMMSVETYIFSHNEEDRHVRAVVGAFSRKLLSNDEVLQWINSFEAADSKGLSIHSDEFVRNYNSNTNKKNFLRCLYFRLKDSNEYTTFMTAIDEAQRRMCHPSELA